MAIVITDKEINEGLENIRNFIKNEKKINCSKTDALRFLLKIPKQGKKTSRQWSKII